MLINDILDLAKIESGTMTVDADDVPFADLRTSLEQTFAQIARDKGLEFEIDPDAAELPRKRSRPTQRRLAGAEEPAFKCVQIHRPGQCDAADRAAAGGWNSTRA